MGQTQAICLCMIVKDEAHVIKRCLDSVRPHITHWAIVDTGSTDDTREIIRRELDGIPGRLIEHEWTDFATERNRSLDLGRRVLAFMQCTGGYLLTIDADESFFPEPGFAMPELEADSYALPFRLNDTDQIWARRVFLKASKPWRYEGEIHEHLECSEPYTNGKLAGLRVWSRSDGARSKLGPIEKSRRDAKVLERLVKKHPDDPRLWFYLGQSYAGAQDIDRAIWAYQKRLELQGFDEERYTARFQIGCLREFRGDHIDDVRAEWIAAFNERPHRAEPLWALAVSHSDRGEPAMAEVYARAACMIPRPPDALIVSESIYLWRCADELAGALAKLGRGTEAIPILRKLLGSPNLPASERERVAENLAYLERELAPEVAA